ncbi:preprotein translocase subunit SecA [Acinetobacter sp. R933-2]|uniref:Preprotein translocase subunit SecA n=2 Tax=Acinetobacter sichuanensis TaxID=2136183 RepID=A0A371YQH2_9GAMM|nr:MULTISPECIES: preprotein translocase subunit SecA [Acinetobacter]MDM1249341.1 preprotein translocase subunit SecA [Acinetobacter sp. R933-2]MDQ9020911.1 preprotein translocase subunit SecA [Acinetobacter sichuanensis]RFC83614.1 preprotein translocase subunit SecA [Acinetobacter sichuanensis]
MTDHTMAQQKSIRPENHNTLGWRLFLVYDILMMAIIVFNLFCLCANVFLMSSFGQLFFDEIHLPQVLAFYKSDLHPWVIKTEGWFILFLVVELAVRWLIAIIYKHHQRWFFFPFVHWYEILAIIPYLRFLRLIRAGIIAYRLHELGYKVIPDNIMKKVLFYYRVVMEEISDRVVVSVIDGIKYELDTSSSHKKIIHDLVDHHRDIFAQALAEILQDALANELKAQQNLIADHVGHIVKKAIEDTPQLTQLLRLIPIAGSMIENQIQNIGQQLGENITHGLIDPLTEGSHTQPNQIYTLISDKVSQLNIENKKLEELVESVVYESLESLRKQVKIKQWQIELEKYDQSKD